MFSTIKDALFAQDDTAVALESPARPALRYADLHRLIEQTVRRLNSCGIGRRQRLAIVMPNGPELASCFLACSAGATCAPLNPAYTEDEFAFYLADLHANALVVQDNPAATAAAIRLGIPVLRVKVRSDQPAGMFQFEGATGYTELTGEDAGWAHEGDVALLLHTSGTTSRPKLVPLTQANLVRSALNVGQSLALTHTDCGLVVMPLFHIHGLVAGVMASLVRGARIFCTPGFNALKFFGWLDEARPSWFTAVPTMHQAILARAPQNRDVIARSRLRFMRTSSAPMPVEVMLAIEKTFQAPLIEAYGMTEASHQITSNPLPPLSRRLGTVGLATGPELVILDSATGRHLGSGEIGEIAIKGGCLTSGYERNDKANAENFIDGWFRTGDQGSRDAEGYVTITGRLKEIINRGGEKISPREIDELLLTHPAVAQALCFALPHPMLGEEVAAVVVVRENLSADERELQQFLATRTAAFKVPKRILFMDDLPKGATGKLQRIGLATRLGLA